MSLAADHEYLKEKGVRELIDEFVRCAGEDKPTDVYTYMNTWVKKKQEVAAATVAAPPAAEHEDETETYKQSLIARAKEAVLQKEASDSVEEL